MRKINCTMNMISDIVRPSKLTKIKNLTYLVYGLALVHRGGHYQALRMFLQSFYHRQRECYFECYVRIEIAIKLLSCNNFISILWIEQSIVVSHFDV